MLLGTEGAGLSARWSEGADVTAKIGMHAGIDSLNVAAASAVACYVLGPGDELGPAASDQDGSSSRGDTGQSSG